MKQPYPKAALHLADRPAKRWIWIFSVAVFFLVVVTNRIQIPTSGTWDVHVFARANALMNTAVSVLLLVGLFTAKAGNWMWHRRAMLGALVLSLLFLLSYVAHHLFAGETPFGGPGAAKVVYYAILATHIPLAGLSLPFILLTAYRSLSGQWHEHRRLARRVWPIWFYVSVSGVLVYFMISPYY